MRRTQVSVVVLVAILTATFGLNSTSGGAQEGTPVASPVSSAEGVCPPFDGEEPQSMLGEDVAVELLGQGVATALDDRTLALYRYTFAPEGTGIPQGCYLDPVVMSVQEGEGDVEMTLTVFEGTVVVTNREGESETIYGESGGVDVTLQGGFSFFAESADYSLVNAGFAEAEIVVSAIRRCPCPVGPIPPH